MTDKISNPLVWLGIGAGAASVFATMIFLFWLSVQKNSPLMFENSSYNLNLLEEEICFIDNPLLET